MESRLQLLAKSRALTKEGPRRREAFDLFLISRSYTEVAKETGIPKAKLMRWSYEDNWGAAIKQESEAVMALASVNVAEAKITLAETLLDMMNDLIHNYARDIEPESLTELLEVVGKSSEIVNTLLGNRENNGQPAIQNAIVNLVGESKDLFQRAIHNVS